VACDLRNKNLLNSDFINYIICSSYNNIDANKKDLLAVKAFSTKMVENNKELFKID
jgi:hypothetical protein